MSELLTGPRCTQPMETQRSLLMLNSSSECCFAREYNFGLKDFTRLSISTGGCVIIITVFSFSSELFRTEWNDICLEGLVTQQMSCHSFTQEINWDTHATEDKGWMQAVMKLLAFYTSSSCFRIWWKTIQWGTKCKWWNVLMSACWSVCLSIHIYLLLLLLLLFVVFVSSIT